MLAVRQYMWGERLDGLECVDTKIVLTGPVARPFSSNSASYRAGPKACEVESTEIDRMI